MSGKRVKRPAPRGRLRKLPDPTEIADGELRKSSHTRLRIMEAAVHCLAEFGYAGVNAATVAAQAGLTRPAMLYHFPTRLALIEGVIHFVVRRRIETFEAEVASVLASVDSISTAIDKAWEQNKTPLYRAYCELSNAAHTDPDLAAIFTPAMAEYDRARLASATQLFTPEQQQAPGFHLRRDVTRFLLDGLATHGWIVDGAAQRREALIGFLKALSSAPEAGPLLECAQSWARRTKSPGAASASTWRSKPRLVPPEEGGQEG